MKAKNLPLLSTLFVAIVCGAGFATVFVGLGEGLLSVFQASYAPRPNLSERQNIAFTTQGEAVLQVNVPIDQSGYNIRREYRNLDGSPLEIGDENILSGCFLYLDRYTEGEDLYKPRWENRLAVFQDFREDPAYWYVVHNGETDGRAYFAGFDVRSRARVGYIGAKGFSDTVPLKEEWFDFTFNHGRNVSNQVESLQGRYYRTQFPTIHDHQSDDAENGFLRSVVYIQDDHHVYEVDLKNRQSKVLFESTEETVHKVNFLYSREPEENDSYYLLAVRTDSRVLLFDGDGRIEESLILPEEYRDLQRLEVYRTVDGRYFLDESGYCVDCGVEGYPADARLGEVTATFVASSGEILSQENYYYDPKKPNVPFQFNGAFACASIGPGICYGMIFILSPIAQILVHEVDSYWAAVWNLVDDLFKNFGKLQMWHLLAFTLLGQILAFYLARRCWLRENRYHSPNWERRMWTGLVLFFGLPGWVGYMAHRHWPVLESCVTCEEPFPVDSQECPACGSQPATPAIRGNEIFAS